LTARLSIRVERLPHAADLPLPCAASEVSVGLDLRAALEGELELGPMERVRVPTGLVIAIPRGYEGQVRPRSGLAIEHGLTVVNAPGTIDADYRGEVAVLLVNLGSSAVRIRRGERIAQLVVAPVVAVSWVESDDLIEDAESGGGIRGGAGFGSTGRD